MLIHFICRGNAVRSIMSEAYLKSLNIPNVDIISSGAVADIYREHNKKYLARAKALLLHHGITVPVKEEAQQLTQAFVDEATLNICVNQRAYDDASKVVTLPDTTLVWHIDDIGEGDRQAPDDARDYFEEVMFQEVKAHVDTLVSEVLTHRSET